MIVALTQFIIIVTSVGACKSSLRVCSVKVLLLIVVEAVSVADLQTVAGHTEQFVTCTSQIIQE